MILTLQLGQFSLSEEVGDVPIEKDIFELSEEFNLSIPGSSYTNIGFLEEEHVVTIIQRLFTFNKDNN